MNHHFIRRCSQGAGAIRGLVKYLPMPRLSPTMKSGMIRKWFIKPQDEVQSYQLVVEVSVKSLLQVSRNETDYIMEIEILEDMYVANILAKEGEECRVGQAIATLCDEKNDIKHLQEETVRYAN